MGSVRWAQIELKAGSEQGPCAQGLPKVKDHHHTRLGPPSKLHECTETGLTIIMLLSLIFVCMGVTLASREQSLVSILTDCRKACPEADA